MYLPKLFARVRCECQFFKLSLTGLNSEFSFFKTGCHTKIKKPNLPYYLLIAGGRIVGRILFPKALTLCEMQTDSSRVLTLFTPSIFYDDNTTSASYMNQQVKFR